MNRKARRNKKGYKIAKKFLDLLFTLDTINLYKLCESLHDELLKREDYDSVNEMYNRGDL